MGKLSYLAVKSDPVALELTSSNFNDLGDVAKKLANHAITLIGLGFGTSFLKWLAFIAAVYFC
ncbi:OLC1v1038374C1 [Oldenlandia corymbosa var. corymbosa]|uniref:OLC1v1038374C1 n=2 Tax=Oldenlandia corymbosa var. corymbosa TaxID=529605 RepID=A0AAV1CZK7_OLDCO|nr:OLC1v1038374C1 [Oldenlandia corymbosa var. corymbosa]